MWKVTLKNLSAKKLRFVLTALAVTLGVAFMSGTLVLTDTIQRTFDDLFSDIYRDTDAVVRSPEALEYFGQTQREPVPASLLREVEGVDGVKVADGSVQAYAQVVDKDGDPIGDPAMGPPTFGTDWTDVDELNPMNIIDGHEPRTNDDVAIDKGTADKGKLKVGDRVEIQSQVAPKTYTLVGVARFGTIDSPGGASVSLFTEKEIQRLAKYDNEFDEIAVVADEGVTQTDIRDRIRADLGRKYEVLTGTEVTKENQDNFREGVGFFSKALLVFAGVALLVGIFIIYNTFSIIVAQRNREMALLRAVGASRRQVMNAVLGESLVVGLLASAIGLVAGVLLSTGLKSLLNAFGFDIPGGGTVISPSSVIVAFAVGTGITLLSAIVPARKASRTPPIAAMRAVAIERTSQLGRRAAIGAAIVVLGVLVLLWGLFGAENGGIALVGVGALAVFVGVFVLGPLFARRTEQLAGARERGA
jgi:putative ABC transport system permease protein